MKKLLVVAAMAVGLAGPAFAWSGTDQNGARIEIDPQQAIRPGLDIEVLQGGEMRALSIESMRRSGDDVVIEGRNEDGDPVTLNMQGQDPQDADEAPLEDD